MENQGLLKKILLLLQCSLLSDLNPPKKIPLLFLKIHVDAGHTQSIRQPPDRAEVFCSAVLESGPKVIRGGLGLVGPRLIYAIEAILGIIYSYLGY